MDLFLNHKRIISIVAALMVVVLVVYSYGSFRSYAASPEISSLPADIDIDVDYSADTVIFTYAGNTYSIDRNHNVNLTHYSYGSSSRYNFDYNYPETFERFFNGNSCYASYWFSPSELRVYVMIARSEISKVRCYVPSANYGTFCVCDKYENVYYYMITIDYSSGSAVYNKMSSQDAIDYREALISSYDEFRNRSCDDLYACKLFDSSSLYVNYYRTGYLDGDYFYAAQIGYKASGELNSSDYASNYHYIPNDLLCIFSNYEISGFYEPDTSKVNTPSYYFNYQYIFYKEGYGYIFVDSAKRCKEVGFPNGVNRPMFYFEAEGNNYVYSSVDGITWTLKSSFEKYTSNFMFNNKFEVNCGSYAFTDYTLVYTNDSRFVEEPLVTPDYGSITDVTDNLKDIVNDKPLSGRLVSLFTDMNLSDLLLRGFIADGFDIWVDSSDNSTHIGPRGGAPDDPHVVQSVKSFPSISMYLYNLVNEQLNIDTKLSALRTDLHADLKSIFTNITLTNQYLKHISDNLDSLSIPAAAPDYSSQFDKLSAALDKLHNDLIYEEGVTKLPNVPQYLVYIYGVTKDIRTRLDTIISKMPAGSGSVDVDTDSIVTAINESATSLTATVDSGNDKLHSDLNYIKALMTIDTVNKLFGDDEDSQNIFTFVSKGISSIVTGSIISDALAFSTQTKDGIVYISSYVNKFYDAVPVYSSIVTVGASFFIIDMVLRRKS